VPAGKLRGVTAAPVVLGIRPEDVLRDSAPGWPVLTGVVDSVLPVGSDRFLGLKVEGCDVFVRVDKETHHVQGQRVSFGLRPERLHLFDKASGASLIGGAV
jgi:multiple sugar transport system ATP-binding protein